MRAEDVKSLYDLMRFYGEDSDVPLYMSFRELCRVAPQSAGALLEQAIALLREIVIHHSHTPMRDERGEIVFFYQQTCAGCRSEVKRREFLEGGDEAVQTE